MEDWVRSLIGTTGPLNGFVHCAGIQRPFSINMAKPKDIEEMFRVNTMASIELIRNFCKPGSYVKDESSFVLVSSQAAHEGSLGNAVYAATKGALEGFLAPGAAELARKGIRLNAIVPGFVQTPMTDNFLKHLSDEQKLNFMAKFPLGLGEPSSIAAMAEFLVSDASNWITGQKFVVDGGRSISPV
jgi:NAD(P)-dependent dehydrogenase (short-subunit alcohol dehydrogenase family)